MTIHQYEAGDLVSHVTYRKTVGILVKPSESDCDTTLPDTLWDIYWLQHPDVEQYGNWATIVDKWIRPFKPWPGFYEGS